MDGNFKGDFTRDTFYPLKYFSRVLMQQGRVQLDADWNEQADILLRLIRHLAKNLIGPQGGPVDGAGFAITVASTNNNLLIGTGDYYIDGILVENRVENEDVDDKGNPIPYAYNTQPYYTPPTPLPLKNPDYYLVYADVWEQQITYLEDAGIREVALGESRPDTATRALVVWQVKVISSADFNQDKANLTEIHSQFAQPNPPNVHQSIKDIITARLRALLQPAYRGLLKARAKVVEEETDACITPPDSAYRGDENQLYRVEIHNAGSSSAITAGSSASGKTSTRSKSSASAAASVAPTFKWSRDNGSVVFPIIGNPESGDKTTTVIIANLGRDEHLSVEQGDWVEVVDEDYVLQGLANPLLKVSKVDKTDPLNILLTLDGVLAYQVHVDRHPVVRRWDQKARQTKRDGEPDLFDPTTGTVQIVEGSGEGTDDIIEHWITLEDGVQIQFQSSNPDKPTLYRTGDYWLIPARVITGDVEWPVLEVGPPVKHKALPPRGVEHHYAPLAVIHIVNDSIDNTIADLRSTFKTLVDLTNP